MEQILVRHITAAVEHELVAIHNAAFPHHEHMNARYGLLAGNAHNVSVQVARRNRVLFVRKRIDCIDARLDAARTLEIKFSGRIAHFARELVNEFTAIARKKTLDPFDIMPVFLGGNTAAARTRPKTYVRIEARPRSRLRQKSLERPRVELALQAAPFVAFRRTNRHDFARDIDQLARRATVGIRAEIPRTFYVFFARVLNSGKNIAFRNRDERIAFIVFEVGIEKRGELVNEVFFEHERLMLVVHHHVLERRHLLKHHRDFSALVLPHDVLLHTGAKLLCFADVDYLP